MTYNFEQILRKLIAGKYYGEFVSMFQGGGVEKKDIRPYQIGDDAKGINRKISAKQESLYVNVFHQEKDATLQVFFDVNANRLAGGDIPNLSIITQYYLDLVVYCLKHGVHVECFLPQYGSVFAYHVGKDKIRAHGFITDLEAEVASQKHKNYRSLLDEFLQLMTRNTKRRGIMIFSDFLSLTSANTTLLKALRKDHALYLFRLPVSDVIGTHYEQWYAKLPSMKEFTFKDIQ